MSRHRGSGLPPGYQYVQKPTPQRVRRDPAPDSTPAVVEEPTIPTPPTYDAPEVYTVGARYNIPHPFTNVSGTPTIVLSDGRQLTMVCEGGKQSKELIGYSGDVVVTRLRKNGNKVSMVPAHLYEAGRHRKGISAEAASSSLPKRADPSLPLEVTLVTGSGDYVELSFPPGSSLRSKPYQSALSSAVGRDWDESRVEYHGWSNHDALERLSKILQGNRFEITPQLPYRTTLEDVLANHDRIIVRNKKVVDRYR